MGSSDARRRWQKVLDRARLQGRASQAFYIKKACRDILSSLMVANAPQYKNIAIYDFDGTLFRSPSKPSNYEGDNWWGDPSSLSAERVGQHPKDEMWRPEVVASMRKDIEDPSTYVAVMTGRRSPFQDRLHELLQSQNLAPDSIFTNPSKKPKSDTSSYKKRTMEYLAQQLPSVKSLHFWEDRLDHLKEFGEHAQGLGWDFVPHPVQDLEKVNKPLYIGVFLSPQEQQKLLQDFAPKHPQVTADHVTLAFKPDPQKLQDFLSEASIGSHIPLRVTGVAEDEKGQALRVELPEGLAAHAKPNAHITISTATGTKPVYSNELLEKGPVQDVPARTYQGYLDIGPRENLIRQAPAPTLSQPVGEEWEAFLKEEMINPNYGRGSDQTGRKLHVQRDTVYQSGSKGKRHVLRDWYRRYPPTKKKQKKRRT